MKTTQLRGAPARPHRAEPSGGSPAALSVQAEASSRWMPLLVLAVLSAIGVAPLAQSGWPATQVGVLPILRLLGADLPPDTLLAGDASWIYSAAELLTQIGVAPAGAIKLLAALAIVVGVFGAYALVGQTWGRASGLLAATFFLFLPIQISLRFVQGVLGTPWFWAVVLWGAWGVARPERVRSLVVGIVLVLVSLLTWPAATVLAVPPLVLLAGNGWWRGGRWRWLVGGWVVGALVVAGLRWSSAEPGLVLAPFQLFSAAWPEPTPGAWVRGGSYSLGLLAVIGALFVLMLEFGNETGRQGDKGTRGQGDREARSDIDFSPAPRPLRSSAPPVPGSSVPLLAVGAAVLLAILPLLPPAARLVDALGGVWTLVGLSSLILALVAARLPLVEPALRELPWLAVLVGLVALRGYGLLTVPTLDADIVPTTEHHAAFETPEGGATFLLLDAQVDGAAEPGGTVAVTTRWQLLQSAPHDYTAFVHLVGPDGATVAQSDRLLLTPDERPSSRWGVGEIVMQSYRIDVPAEAPTGAYTVRTGLYAVETLERLPRVRGGDAIEVQP